ncbi:Formin-binding protein 1-like [Bagarius yarrelli]|uniref:Formin-binding protein 1-like n=1 Tax=Bagarius yarrelli TaxID=175774 RepID=A0A556U7U4_BAGYA|nr:Formin-binding protein 1-like [Bagarius yarrelli]
MTETLIISNIIISTEQGNGCAENNNMIISEYEVVSLRSKQIAVGALGTDTRSRLLVLTFVLAARSAALGVCSTSQWIRYQDQFENLDKHTQWGIDFLERYAKFVKERLEIEQNYAKQLRNLVKKYCPKRSKEDEPRFTSCLSFYSILNELNDYAGQREVVAEEMGHRVYGELLRYSQDLKAERKHHLQEARKAQQYLEQCWKQMDNAKSQLYLRTHMADESKNEYAAQLQNFNAEQWKHFHMNIPQIFKHMQEMDERRTVKLGETYRSFAEVERKVIPIVSKCLEGMVTAAKNVDERKDSLIVVESFKSGFEPPTDFPFEDFSQNIQRTGSDGTIGAPKNDPAKPDPKPTMGKSKNKLWLFGKKPKLPPPAPPPPIPSVLSAHFQSPKFPTERISYCLNEMRTVTSKIPTFRSLKRGAPNLEDLSHLPPEQRRKKLQQRIDELSRELQKEMDQRDALNKMKDVYEKNPQMGDPGSLQPKISETICNMEKLRSEIHKNEVISPVTYIGSYTDDPNQEHRAPPPPDQHEFDDEFEDDDPLPAIGHCKALYSFDGSNEGTLVMKEEEVLYIIEEDKGDGWTRVRKQSGEEGYVPTSYVEITLEKHSKGAVTYI